jgi:glycosyltransferase involved in cell wall biosynthesis
MNALRRIAAYILLIGVYGFTWLAAVLGRQMPRRRWRPTGRIMVTGTFFNPNWYLSHVTPLARSGLQEVILVVDEPQLPLEGVRFVCPPRWAAQVFSRAGAKAIWMILAGRRYRPDLYMGYHIAPGACSALVAGRLLGRPACYQMTAGPVEIIGGGIGAIESMGALLRRPSHLIERMALAVVRQFDLVVVRGRKADEFLSTKNLKGTVAIITGSINGSPPSPHAKRDIDLVFVGRLVPAKQVDQFIATVSIVSRTLPSVRAVAVGDGPLMAEMQDQARRLGIATNVEFLGKQQNVRPILLRSKIFLLTSQSEGLSIAMAEAMAAGAVPVVADVGELGDLVAHRENGYLVPPNSIEEYAADVTTLLQDPDGWAKASRRAVECAREHCHVSVISQRWQQYLQDTIAHASGTREQGVLV